MAVRCRRVIEARRAAFAIHPGKVEDLEAGTRNLYAEAE